MENRHRKLKTCQVFTLEPLGAESICKITSTMDCRQWTERGYFYNKMLRAMKQADTLIH